MWSQTLQLLQYEQQQQLRRRIRCIRRLQRLSHRRRRLIDEGVAFLHELMNALPYVRGCGLPKGACPSSNVVECDALNVVFDSSFID
ncbi:hypothetical protein TIFTF001_006972 [Ficus carica]|uniref:Uncharacterized protein n=1 Tax=Ficus carica TaxID=3494 RepID=A0AA88A5E0_FICCA|nr:hypothetical protein TIFTF001_006972 [Ficus carica]